MRPAAGTWRSTTAFHSPTTNRRNPMRHALALALLLSGVIPRASAQTVTATTGAINGIVTDSTKALLPGVTVTLSGPSLMGVQTVVTDHEGAYRFSAVPRGDYRLTFELSGFGTV